MTDPDGLPDSLPMPRGPRPMRDRANGWDRLAGLVLMVPLALLCITASYTGMIAGTTASACTGPACDTAAITVGLILTTFGPIVVFFLALFVVIRGVLTRRLIFWIPLVGFIALAILWYAGVALATAVL